MLGALKHRVHTSWFIGWFCFGVVTGTGLCAVINNNLFADKFWLAIVVCMLILCTVKRWRLLLILIFAAGNLLGLYRSSLLLIDLEEYRIFFGHTIVLQGKVTQDTSIGEKGDQRFNLSQIKINQQDLKGEIWVSVNKADIKRGDIVQLSGQLSEGFGNLSATMYRAQVLQVERPYPGDVARRVRDWFASGVKLAIPEPQASLGLGYLVGQKTALPPDLEEQIKITGLTHVVVASGYNLTILVGFARKLFTRVSKFVAAVAGSLMTMSFMLVTGLSPSMSRAGLVAGLGLLVWYYGRKMHPFVLLSFAAGLTVAIKPSYVWGDLGWYLSFTAFIGVIVLAPLLQHYFWGRQDDVPMLRQLLIDTMSAQIVTSPVIFLSFGLLSVYALPANILVLPFVPFAMLMTFFAGIGGLIVPSLAAIVGFPATLILKYSTTVIKWVAELPGSQNELEFNLPLMIASYICMGIVITYLIRRTNHDFRKDSETKDY